MKSRRFFDLGCCCFCVRGRIRCGDAALAADSLQRDADLELSGGLEQESETLSGCWRSELVLMVRDLLSARSFMMSLKVFFHFLVDLSFMVKKTTAMASLLHETRLTGPMALCRSWYFPVSASFRINVSSVRFDTARGRLALSCSISFILWAWLTSMPPCSRCHRR